VGEPLAGDLEVLLRVLLGDLDLVVLRLLGEVLFGDPALLRADNNCALFNRELPLSPSLDALFLSC